MHIGDKDALVCGMKRTIEMFECFGFVRMGWNEGARSIFHGSYQPVKTQREIQSISPLPLNPRTLLPPSTTARALDHPQGVLDTHTTPIPLLKLHQSYSGHLTHPAACTLHPQPTKYSTHLNGSFLKRHSSTFGDFFV